MWSRPLLALRASIPAGCCSWTVEGTGRASGTGWIVWLFALGAGLFAAWPATPAGAQPVLADWATLTPISDGNAGTDDRGYAAAETNATAFKDQSLVTVGDYQFTSYYGADQQLILGRRNLATDPNTWFLLRTGQFSTDIGDSHTVSTIGIDGDGFLHTAWGLHDDPIRYTRSTTSVLNDDPFTVMAPIANPIPIQSGFSNSYSYPEFYSIPGSGDLLFTFRFGSSGNGEYQLARWNNATDAWSAVHVAAGSGNANTGPQPWIDNDFNSTQAPPNVNAYHNGLVHDSTGRLHVTWTWRTGGDSTTGFTDYQSNHNFMYAYSDDNGVSWRKDDDTLYSRNGVHDIDENNATPVVSLPDGSSIINQSSAAVGPDDHYYLATWYAPQAGSGNHVRQYMLVEYDGTNWEQHQITSRNPEGAGIGTNRVPESQLGSARMSRPIAMTDEANRVFVVYSDVQRGQGVTVAYSESADRDDWQFLDLTTNENMRLWEPKYDQARWETDGVLSMLYQPSGQGLSPNAVSILEWDARSYFQNLAGPPLRLEVDRGTGAVVVKNPDSSAAITDYTIGSASGQLAPGGWLSLADQGFPGWMETQSSATGMAESNVVDSLVLNQNESVGLGTAYAGSAIAFGVDAPGDLTFTYTANEEERTGTVTYVGQSSNNLTLKVDPTTGQARLENTSPFSVSIEAYTIASASGSLDVANWNSLDDQNAAGGNWHEANPSAQRVSELISAGSTLLAGSDEYDLGTLFDAAAGEEDLVLQFLIAGQGAAKTGVVLYTALGVPGDYNDDGTVDAGDYVTWRNTIGTATMLPNDTTPGTVTSADYDVWRAHFGQSAAIGSGSGAHALGAVPEPASGMLAAIVACSAAASSMGRRRDHC